MKFSAPGQADWQQFLEWARLEGWRVPNYELEMLQASLSHAALVLKEGDFLHGLVTAVAYEKNGWIGNLLVPAALRGRGFGRKLFERAVANLDRQGVAAIWLTASDLGAPLYAQYGFETVGTIARYVRPAGTDPRRTDVPITEGDIGMADRRAWSEDRSCLLERLQMCGTSLQCGTSSALLQAHDDVQVIGPWYAFASETRDLRTVLGACIGRAERDRPLIVDLAAPGYASLLCEFGFRLSGKNRLMVKGCRDHVDLGSLVSLASLGSMG